MFKSNKLAVLAALLSLLMLVSMLAVVPAFAEDAEATAEETTVAETVEATEPESSDETEAGTTAGTDAESGSSTEASTKEETTTEADTTEEAEAKKQQRTRGIINLVVGGVILVILVVLIVINRAKIPAWWKGLKSECGKITWCPKDKLKKNTIVVVCIILAIALVIFLLDLAFSEGMIYLGKLFH